MTNPVVLHIGYHKTATTWFQGIFYPAVRNVAYLERRRVVDAFLTDPAFHFDPAEARRRLGLEGPEPPLAICEEELCGYPHNAGLGGFQAKETAVRLARTFPQAQVVIFLRRQPDMIAACYMQYVREGGTHAPRRYLFPAEHLRGARARIYKMPRFNFEQFEYDRLIAHYQALFGPERVHVFCYEAFRAEPTAFLNAFAERLGLDVDVAGLPAGTHANRSYSRALLQVARRVNLASNRKVLDKTCLMHIPGWYQGWKRLLKRLNATGATGAPPTPREIFGDELHDWIERRYESSNRRLAQITECPLSEFAYPLSPPTPDARTAGGN